MKKINQPIMEGCKTCIRCSSVKHVTEFHAHKMMRDGRLNKCAVCVKESVSKWRLKNPDSRSVEHFRVAAKRGIKTREQYLKDVSENSIGRRSSSLKYSHKRYAQKRGMPVWDMELDDFAIEEAKRLADMRWKITGIQWSVDHIVPMNHRLATGLHNAFNLNVAPASWNSSKSNRHMNRFLG
jgi:hypothetical protein